LFRQTEEQFEAEPVVISSPVEIQEEEEPQQYMDDVITSEEQMVNVGNEIAVESEPVPQEEQFVNSSIQQDEIVNELATPVMEEKIVKADMSVYTVPEKKWQTKEEGTKMIDSLILRARAMGCSDMHITVGMPLMFRINGKLQIVPDAPNDAEIEAMLLELLDEKQKRKLEESIDLDFAIKSSDGNRQRVNIFKQEGNLAATIRLLNSSIPSLDMLGLPPVLKELANRPRGLILVTGPTGSGKSTTLAAMIDSINSTRSEHIITIEDPIEYKYERKLSLIHQREVGKDIGDFAAALRSALREDPDIILVGEMRDYETIAAALTAAETGHLVMSTLHTTGAAQTIDRIIDACPAAIQNQIRTQLAGVLNGVITQCLVPNVSGNGRLAATEILVGTDAVCNLIRENKCHQMNSLMQSGNNVGMHTLNNDLARLVHAGMISMDNAIRYSNDKAELDQYF